MTKEYDRVFYNGTLYDVVTMVLTHLLVILNSIILVRALRQPRVELS